MRRNVKVLPHTVLCYLTPLPQEHIDITTILRNSLTPKVSPGCDLCKNLPRMDQWSLLSR